MNNEALASEHEQLKPRPRAKLTRGVPAQLSPSAAAEVRRILDAEARRLLAESQKDGKRA